MSPRLKVDARLIDDHPSFERMVSRRRGPTGPKKKRDLGLSDKRKTRTRQPV